MTEQSKRLPRRDRTRARGLRDIAIRVVGIPFFGLAIPRVTGTLAGLELHDRWYWIGTGWFLLLSLGLWQGNRWLLLRRRERSDWLDEPGKKLVGLLFAHVAFTSAVTLVAMLAWYEWGPFAAVEWEQVALVTGVVVVAVLLVTHAYETMFLIHDRLEDRLDLEQMERARLLTELSMMKSQLTPHFLFNCLHTLGVLIAEDPTQARLFNQHMAGVCRYLLKHQRRDLVPLVDELGFFHAYVELTRLRFPDSVRIELHDIDAAEGLLIPPASLQLLLENAVKHNVFNESAPLMVQVRLAGATISVANGLRRAAAPAHSEQVGLQNLRERYLLAVGAEISVEERDGWFCVTLPLVRATKPRSSEAAEEEVAVRN